MVGRAPETKMRISRKCFARLYLWNRSDGSGTVSGLNFLSPISTVALLILTLTAHSQTVAKQAGTTDDDEPSATEMRLLNSEWWPTKAAASRDEYSGSAACARCHAEKVTSYASTQMAHALAPINSATMPELTKRPLHRTIGSYNYSLEQTPAGTMFSVSNGTESLSAAIGWVFGVGEIGRTYVYEQSNRFYESHLSYYSQLQNLDFTTGHPRLVPDKLELALGRPIADPGACFSCHSTEATIGNHFDPQHLIPGVTCEGCHGPGAEHVALMSAGQSGQVPSMIFDPAKLSPVAAVDFCGACHRTSVDVSFLGVSGRFTLRFPAYRLQGSRCWSKPDSRLTCFACHDPHQPLVRETSSYDKNCLACHRGGPENKTASSRQDAHSPRTGPSCPVAQKECVTCHMPRYQVQEMHATFTDHTIAIYKEAPKSN